MPYLHIRITKDGVSREQKSRLVAEVTETLQRVLHKRPEHTHVVIEEVELDNWGFAGRLTSDLRREDGGVGAVQPAASASLPDGAAS